MLSNRLEGVLEFDREGEAYESRRFRVGVVGGAEEVEARTGDGARWTGVVTSECSTDVKMELACSAARFKVSSALDRKAGTGGWTNVKGERKRRRTFECVGLCGNQSALRRGGWATLVFKVVGCAHVAGITVRNKTISVLLVPLSHAVPPGSGRFRSGFGGGRESAVERGGRGVGYAEDGMDFWTVPSVTVSIFDILLSGAETLSERRVLETGHGMEEEGGRWMAMRRVRAQVAYVVAVIGQEKARDQTTRLRVDFVEVMPPL